MKNAIFCLTFLSVIISYAQNGIECKTNGSIDGITLIEVTNSDIKGHLTVIRNIKTENNNFTRLLQSSKGNLSDQEILVSETDNGPKGIDRVYLSRTLSQKEKLIKTNQCSFYDQDKVCPLNSSEEFVSETTINCKNITIEY